MLLFGNSRWLILLRLGKQGTVADCNDAERDEQQTLGQMHRILLRKLKTNSTCGLKLQFESNLALSAGQPLGNSAKGCGLSFLRLHRGGIGVVEQIKEFEQALQ